MCREDRLDVDLMASLKPARVFHIVRKPFPVRVCVKHFLNTCVVYPVLQENDVRANSIDFDAKGDLMVLVFIVFGFVNILFYMGFSRRLL